MGAVDLLSTSPERGEIPEGIAGLGIKEFRQTFFKPYRVVFTASSWAARSSSI